MYQSNAYRIDFNIYATKVQAAMRREEPRGENHGLITGRCITVCVLSLSVESLRPGVRYTLSTREGKNRTRGGKNDLLPLRSAGINRHFALCTTRAHHSVSILAKKRGTNTVLRRWNKFGDTRSEISSQFRRCYVVRCYTPRENFHFPETYRCISYKSCIR